MFPLNNLARKELNSLAGAHVSHLEATDEEELNRLLGIVVDVENLFMCVAKEEDADTKQVYFYLFKVRRSSGLTHCGLVTPFGDINLGQHWLR